MNFKQKVASFAAVAILATGAFAATEGHQGHQGGAFGQHRLERMATALNLTDAQKATAQTLFDQAKTEAAPIAAQLKQGRQAMAEAVKAGKSDAELATIANQQGTLMGQLAAIRAKAFAKFYAQLTPEQKDKADQMRQQMRNRFQGHRPAADASKG